MADAADKAPGAPAKPENSQLGGDKAPVKAEVGASGLRLTTSGTVYDLEKDVILAAEFPSDSLTKALLAADRLVILAATAITIVQLIWKFSNDANALVSSDKVPIMNVVVGSICLAAVLGVGLLLVWRLVRVARAGKRWSSRRKRAVALFGLELGVQLVNVCLFLAGNAYVLANECSWFTIAPTTLGALQYSLWGVLFLLFCVQGRRLWPAAPLLRWMPWLRRRLPKGLSEGELTIRDMPNWVYLPEFLLLWVPLQVTVVLLICWLTGTLGPFLTCYSYTDLYCSPPTATPGTPCQDWDWCTGATENTGLLVLTSVGSALLMVMLLLYLLYCWVAFRELARKPYLQYRVANIELRTQARTRIVAAVFFCVCIIVYWFIGQRGCTSVMLTGRGLTPMQLVMSALVCFNALLCMPTSPRLHNVVLLTWLQDSAWLESHVPRKLAERPEYAADQPLFCFETCMKAFYWSYLVYELKRTDQGEGGTPDVATGTQRTVELGEAAGVTLETALSLYDLTGHELFWEESLDTVCLVGWGDGTVVLSFRGTASMANVKSDIMAWRVPHPPKRGSYWLGSQPLVHAGFLRSWQVDGLDGRVLDRVRGILAAGAGRPWRILVCGHSLGGALATLASHDLARLFENDDSVTVQCLTFGCPRVGNHAFRKERLRAVPWAFDVVHGRDPVVNQGKFGKLYKRASQRVVLTPRGDILVRPSHVEASLRRGTSRLADHYLSSYGRSLLAVLRAQFGLKAGGRRSGVLAAQSLLRTRFVGEVQRLAKLGAGELAWARSIAQQAPARRASHASSRPTGSDSGSEDGFLGGTDASDDAAVEEGKATGGGVVDGEAAGVDKGLP